MLVAEINEKITVRYRGTFNDLDGAPIQLADMTTLNLTMFLEDAGANSVINAWSSKDVLNVNGGTFHATSGLFTLELAPADTALVSQGRSRERHKMEFEFTWASKTGRHEVMLVVKNLGSVV